MSGALDPVVSLAGVWVRDGRRCLLQDLTLSFPPRSLTAVLGPNGAGKTTLLRLLDGEIAPSSGTLHVLGENPGALGWRAAACWRRRIGVMAQFAERQPPVPLSVREVVSIGRVAAHSEVTDAKVAHWIERLGLAKLADRPFSRLSGGEQRRAHLARVFAQEPELVLLDEPAGHLDFPGQESLVRLLHRLWLESNVTVILVTHDLRHLPPGLSQVVLLREGRLIRQGPPGDTLTSEALGQTFGEPVNVYHHGDRWSAATKGSDA